MSWGLTVVLLTLALCTSCCHARLHSIWLALELENCSVCDCIQVSSLNCDKGSWFSFMSTSFEQVGLWKLNTHMKVSRNNHVFSRTVTYLCKRSVQLNFCIREWKMEVYQAVSKKVFKEDKFCKTLYVSIFKWICTPEIWLFFGSFISRRST